MSTAALVAFHDETTEVHVNGQKILERSGFNTASEILDVTTALKPALKRGRNWLAVHTHQTGGGQCIDLAVLIHSREGTGPVLGRR